MGAPTRLRRLIEKIRQQIEARVVGQRKEDLDIAVASLWLMQNSSVFPSTVADFLLALGRDPIITH